MVDTPDDAQGKLLTPRERTVRLKLDRGQRQMAQLKTAQLEFWASKARVEEVLDKQARQRHLVLRLQEDPPLEEWALSAGDVLHNLRSALDHLVWQLVLANGNRPGKKNQFPIVADRVNFAQESRRALAGLSTAAANAIEHLQPWPGGANERLWQLHRLDIRDKHQLLLLVTTAYSPGIDFSAGMRRKNSDFADMPALFTFLRPAEPEFHDGQVLVIENLDESMESSMDVTIELGVELVLGENDPPSTRRPLTAFLGELAATVHGTISALSMYLT